MVNKNSASQYLGSLEGCKYFERQGVIDFYGLGDKIVSPVFDSVRYLSSMLGSSNSSTDWDFEIDGTRVNFRAGFGGDVHGHLTIFGKEKTREHVAGKILKDWLRDVDHY